MKRVALFLLCAVALTPSVAFPCGGFFCSGGNGPPPVIQTGEKILFAYENGEVTAHVQILYSGDPRAFAWVVPTPSLPTLSVGSDQLFTLLDQGTQPTFTVNWQNSCPRPISFGCGCGAPVALGGGSFQDAGSEVTVISRGPVGPFETAILTSTDPLALEKWLINNGFDVGPAAQKLIEPYVTKHDHFVALKLQSGKGLGDLQPIILKFASAEGPCVPIRLTALAAQADLGIAVFLLGSSRGVSTNYLNLVLNESRIDWTGQPTVSYPLAVAAAADEAGGHGFITDYAGPSTAVRSSITASLGSYSRANLTVSTPVEFVQAVRNAQLLGTSQNVLAILGRCVPIPAVFADGGSVTPLQFYQLIESFAGSITQTVVEQPRCEEEIYTLVVQPLELAAAAMGRQPTLTRLYTTLSADEMTVDPEFAFNPDLPMVPAARTVTGTMFCDGSTPLRADLTGTDGRRFSIPWNGTNAMAPALLRAEELSAKGPPLIMIDNTKAVDAANARTFTGCGCISGGGGAVFLCLAGLIFVARRRVWA